MGICSSHKLLTMEHQHDELFFEQHSHKFHVLEELYDLLHFVHFSLLHITLKTSHTYDFEYNVDDMQDIILDVLKYASLRCRRDVDFNPFTYADDPLVSVIFSYSDENEQNTVRVKLRSVRLFLQYAIRDADEGDKIVLFRLLELISSTPSSMVYGYVRFIENDD
jgi:hypothetical protein